MIRAQIQFEEKQYEQVKWLARRKRISIAEAVRRLVASGLKGGPDGAEGHVHSLLDIAGIAGSGIGNLGRDHDEYLDEDLDS